MPSEQRTNRAEVRRQFMNRQQRTNLADVADNSGCKDTKK